MDRVRLIMVNIGVIVRVRKTNLGDNEMYAAVKRGLPNLANYTSLSLVLELGLELGLGLGSRMDYR